MNLNFAISTESLLFIVGTAAALGLITIYALRWYYNSASRRLLTKKTPIEAKKLPLLARSKYPQVDVFNLSGIFWKLGFAMVLGIMIGGFNWTPEEKEAVVAEIAYDIEADVEVEPPRSLHETKPPPPPPPPTVIEEVPEELIMEEDAPDFVDQSVEAETEVFAPPPVIAKKQKAKAELPPPPPPPPPPAPEVEEIFKVVEQMPRFPGCESMSGSDDAKKACADRKLMEFIYKNIRYPSIARENNIEGTVVVQFVVDKDGRISNARIIRDIGANCGEEALRVVNLMNQLPEAWTPGRQRARPVHVLFNLPVKFRLVT